MKNINILICDDDQGNLDILALLLEFEGYTVNKENDSTKVMKKIKEDCPDILILDIWMPVLSGDEIIRMIRKDSQVRYLPIIAYSASYTGAQVAIAAGADQYVSKPFNVDEIVGLIGKITVNDSYRFIN